MHLDAIYIVLIFLLILLVFVLFYRKKEVKTKEQKQQEIIDSYIDKMQETLTPLKTDNYQKQKIALLQTFAKELEFNIFFDKNEVREIIKSLANMDF